MNQWLLSQRRLRTTSNQTALLTTSDHFHEMHSPLKTTSFNEFLLHPNTASPFHHLITKICQSLHSHSWPVLPLWNKLPLILRQIYDPSYDLKNVTSCYLSTALSLQTENTIL